MVGATGLSESNPANPKEVSNNFTINPITVTFLMPGKIETIKVTNESDKPLYAQAAIKNYTQSSINGQLVESSGVIKGEAAVMVTPIILRKLPGHQQQILSVVSLAQDESREYTYRLFVHSLVPATPGQPSVEFQIGYSVPIFVLPKNVHESYTAEYVSRGGRAYIKLTNVGNVHISFSTIAAVLKTGNKSASYVIPGMPRILAGSYAIIPVPDKVAKLIKNQANINLRIEKIKLPTIKDKNEFQLTTTDNISIKIH